jgi:hypothetical protein
MSSSAVADGNPHEDHDEDDCGGVRGFGRVAVARAAETRGAGGALWVGTLTLFGGRRSPATAAMAAAALSISSAVADGTPAEIDDGGLAGLFFRQVFILFFFVSSVSVVLVVEWA